MPLPDHQPPLIVGDTVIKLGDGQELHVSTIVHASGQLESLGTLTKNGVEVDTFVEISTIAGKIVAHRDAIARKVKDNDDWRIIDGFIKLREWATIEGDDDNARSVRLHQAQRIVGMLASSGNPEDQHPMVILNSAIQRIRDRIEADREK